MKILKIRVLSHFQINKKARRKTINCRAMLAYRKNSLLVAGVLFEIAVFRYFGSGYRQ